MADSTASAAVAVREVVGRLGFDAKDLAAQATETMALARGADLGHIIGHGVRRWRRRFRLVVLEKLAQTSVGNVPGRVGLLQVLFDLRQFGLFVLMVA